MKKLHYYLTFFALAAFIIPLTFMACSEDDDDVTTTISIDKTTTDALNVGETVTATVTIVASEVKAFNVYKVVDEVKSTPTNGLADLVKDGDNYTYSFSYTIAENDDLHTLGFEFEVTDGKDEMLTTALVVSMNLSTRSIFVKYDWMITAEDWLGVDVLAPHDAAKTFRFYEDGSYEVDLSAAFSDSVHHFCYWVYQETPSNGDTLAIVRLIRKQLSGEVGLDEYYDFNITAVSESEMTMYWDLAVFGLLDIERTFTSQPKGAFQAYGTAELATYIETVAAMDCSTVDENLLTIEY